MRSVLLLTLLTACFEDPPPPLDPADCGTPATFRIDGVELPPNNASAREMAFDLDGDRSIDNQLGMVTGTLPGMFGDAIDLEARAAEHLGSDADWRLAVWQCPGEQRLVALASGPGPVLQADLRGELQGPLITASGASGTLPLGALFDGDGSGEPAFVTAELAVLRLEDPAPGATELTAVLGVALEQVVAVETVVHAMAPFVDANLEASSRDHFDANADGTISEDELRTASFTQALLAPDLTIAGVRALSFGFRLHATRVP